MRKMQKDQIKGTGDKCSVQINLNWKNHTQIDEYIKKLNVLRLVYTTDPPRHPWKELSTKTIPEHKINSENQNYDNPTEVNYDKYPSYLKYDRCTL